MTWESLLSDSYVSSGFDELHARLENYQVYSTLLCDRTEKRQTTKHQPGVNLPPSLVQSDVSFSLVSQTQTATSDGVQRNNLVEYWKKNYGGSGQNAPGVLWVSLEDDPNNPSIMPIDEARANAMANGFALFGVLPKYTSPEYRTGDIYSVQVSVITPVYTPWPNPSNRPPEINTLLPIDTEVMAENAVVYQSFSPAGKIPINLADLLKPYADRVFHGVVRSDYKLLIKGHQNDSRALPRNISVTATSTRIIKYGYYRRNTLETHPKISDTLDWFTGNISTKMGQHYLLPIIDPCLGTLVVDDITKSEIINIVQPGKYPIKYLFSENLGELITQWDTFYPADNAPINPPLASTYTITATGVIPPLTYLVTKLLAVATTWRVMAANNDIWGHGTLTITKNRPPNNHPIFQFDHQKLFEELQPDGSYGTYMTDSPRIMEIWAALGAGTYATYIDENGQQLPRVANLGWLIDKMSNILGLRRKPSGKYLDKVDQAKYDRNRLNSPKWAQGDYDLNSWGNKGYALRHLPTSYENGQRQDNQYDLVHDLPQLLAAVLDQIDLGQGLQHTAEIRMKVGKEVQSYPNVGQLMIDLAARVIELEALVEKMAVMQIETSNSVRELFPGIGIPVATKSVSIDIGGKQQQIFYPGFQAGKGSILDNLSAIKVNLGIVLGQLMPQKKPDSRWNPFDRKPKS
jgi:hypothetical protein